jgi:hypothetical protein
MLRENQAKMNEMKMKGMENKIVTVAQACNLVAPRLEVRRISVQSQPG